MSTLGALSGSVDIDRIMLIEPKFQFTQSPMARGASKSAPEIDRAWAGGVICGRWTSLLKTLLS